MSGPSKTYTPQVRTAAVHRAQFIGSSLYVRSDQEKAAITAKAIEIAGANNVKDEITIKPRG